MTAKKNGRSRLRGESVQTVLKTQGDDRCLLHYRDRHASRDTTQKRSLHIKQVIMRTSCITAMPRSILRVSIRNFNLVFEPHVQTKKRKACPPCFCQTSYGCSFVFFPYHCIAHTSRAKIKTKWGRLSICCLMHDKHRVEKSHQNT